MISPNLITAGHALFTIYNKKTGNKGTYRVTKADKNVYFVGKYNEDIGKSKYIGTIFGNTFRHTKKSSVDRNSIDFRMFEWTFNNRFKLPSQIELLSAGRCCICGYKIKSKKSIESGVGPNCKEQYYEELERKWDHNQCNDCTASCKACPNIPYI